MFSKSGREIYLDYLDRIEKRNQQQRPGDPAPKFSPYRMSTIPKWNPDQQAPEPPRDLKEEKARGNRLVHGGNMSASDITAKAQRAAEWWRATGQRASYHDCLGWCVTEDGSSWADLTTITDRMMIAFCEDRGWVDQEQDADGAEWRVVTETTTIGRLNVWLYTHDGQWRWDLQDINDNDAYVFSSDEMVPTRAEARRQAVEAARGMG